MNETTHSHYKLRCLGDNSLIEDVYHPKKGYLLANPNYLGDALLRTEYLEPLTINADYKNIFKYSWLPVNDMFECDSVPVTFKSYNLAKLLGLENLYCTYSGYAPKLGAYNRSCSFKEFEAIGVMTRHSLDSPDTIVLASAGNTARAFLELGSKLPVKVIIIVPQTNLRQLWTSHNTISPHIKIYTVDGDYSDAIRLAKSIASMDGYVEEGGVKNIGRRDGMGTCFLSAVESMKRIPDHYFQAVGSGSGALSAWEAALRYKTLMNTDGPAVPKLHISQNQPFTPIIDSWETKSPSLLPIDSSIADAQLKEIEAKVLSNRTPPYSIKGGVYDAMMATNGIGYKISNTESREAKEIFYAQEGLRLEAPASVACASLLQAVKSNSINKDDYIMLNLTGGGHDLVQQDFTITMRESIATFSKDASIDTIAKVI